MVWHVIRQIPTGYNRVDIVTDTYRTVSIKLKERDGQGRSNRIIIINLLKSWTTCDFKDFLSNDENKSKLITLTFEYFVTKKAEVLNNLQATKLVLSEEGKITVITLGRMFISVTLSSDQEEIDTKVILHCHDALKGNSNGSIVLRSAAGNTDILVLAVAHLYNEK